MHAQYPDIPIVTSIVRATTLMPSPPAAAAAAHPTTP